MISPGSVNDPFFGYQEDFWLLQKKKIPSSSRKKKHRGLLEPEDDEATDNTPRELMVHYCRLQDLLEPGIILVESRLSTLDLGCDWMGSGYAFEIVSWFDLKLNVGESGKQ